MTDPFFAQGPEDLPPRTALLAMSGLDYMQGMLAGHLPHPGIARIMGYAIDRVEPGRVRFRGTAGFAHTNPFGAVHGGWYGTLLDSALGCAVMTTVPQGRWYTTLEYKVNLTRALPLGVEVLAEGLVEHAGRTTAVARADIRGAADGILYATGTTTCIILE